MKWSLENISYIVTIIIGIFTLPSIIINFVNIFTKKDKCRVTSQFIPTVIVIPTYTYHREYSTNVSYREDNPAVKLALTAVSALICVYLIILAKLWMFLLALTVLALILLSPIVFAIKTKDSSMLLKSCLVFAAIMAYLLFLWIFPYFSPNYAKYEALVLHSSNLFNLFCNVESDFHDEVYTLFQWASLFFLLIAFCHPYVSQAIAFVKRKPVAINEANTFISLAISLGFSLLLPIAFPYLQSYQTASKTSMTKG
jgi:hypothetical protein